MVTGGLSATDLGAFQIIGGYARDFYLEAAAHYGFHDLKVKTHWLSEPHVDEAIFLSCLQKTNVELHFQERLQEHKGVVLQGRQIKAIVTTNGNVWRAKMFADCSYEGDLMAQAKVSYVVGRESTAEYGEDLAGVRAITPKHQFNWPISSYDEHHHLFAGGRSRSAGCTVLW
jgi:hypothetical protein